MFDFPDQYKCNYKVHKKAFLENLKISPKVRTKIREDVKSVQMYLNIRGGDFLSYRSEDYNYSTIQFLKFEVKEAESFLPITSELHMVFKEPVVFYVIDNYQNFFYSLALKRLSKQNTDEIVIEKHINTEVLNDIISSDLKGKLSKYLSFQELLNKDIRGLYYEIFLKLMLIFKHSSISDYEKIIEMKFYYNFDKIKKVLSLIELYESIVAKMPKTLCMKDKIELSNEKKKTYENIMMIDEY
ncbi:UNVERIFIED_CONTAM: uncharacterized protein DUF4391 [Acetivibrio alkalicellulosi]